MTEPLVTVSTLDGETTHVDGRFVLSGPGYQLVADGSLRGGGPGAAIGSADLLLASLVTCALNTLRKPEHEGEPSRRVQCFGRIERRESEDGLGTAILEVFVEGVDDRDAALLVQRYKERCRVYRAIKDSLPVTFIVHGAPERAPIA